jgi:hypothetical protein
MRAELVLGLWLILCGSVGGTRTVLKYHRNPTGRLWVVEGILSVVAWGSGLIYLVHFFALWISEITNAARLKRNTASGVVEDPGRETS